MDYSIVTAKAKLPALVNQALEGREVILTKHGKPVAKIVRIEPVAREPRKFGLHAGTFTILPGFFEESWEEFADYL